MVTSTQQRDITLRGLTERDLDSVVALDQANIGRARHVYHHKRLKAALDQPALHVQFACEHGGKLVGFVMARQLFGQFGRAEPALRLEAMGVASGEQGQGIGSALMSKLEAEARRLGVAEIRTTGSWRDHRILQFFDRAGFELDKVLVVDCPVRGDRLAAHEGDKVLAPGHLTGFSTSEIDYSPSKGNDFEALARDRVDLRTLKPEDTVHVKRIDESVTGRRREGYIEHVVQEALTDSAVRLSLVARVDGIAAGFIMARTDFGDFGRPEPVAVLDTIGVDPDYSHHGVGHALLSQLFINLAGLQVERVETMVSRENFGLLGFLYKLDFAPSQRLAFVKRVS